MHTVLAAGSLAAAGVGTGCCLAGRHPVGATAGAGMAAMLLGMADTMLTGGTLLRPWAWAAVLVGLGLVALAARRRSACDGPSAGPGTLRALHPVAMGVLVLAAVVGPGGPTAGHAPGHHGAGALGVAPVPVVAVAVAVGYAVACAVEARRRGDVLLRAELAAAATSTLAMAAMPWLSP